MKFGAHSYIFTDRWSDSSLHFLEDAKELGLDCFEIGIGDDVIFSYEPVRRQAEQLNLELIVSPGGLWPMVCDLSSEDAVGRKAGLEWHRRQVDIAHELGAIAYCGSLYGHTGVVKKRKPLKDEYQWIAEELHKLASYGEGKGVAIILEPMSHFRTHLVNTPSQVVRLMEMSDHPNLWALLDTYHMITEVRDYAEGIRTVGRKLWGMHMCENDRGVPGGGLMPWSSISKALAETDFNGHLIMEAYNSSIRDFAYERGMFHNVCPDPDSFIKDGLRFLKEIK
jgi:D-psicose/D-tagatose/L-ribulose 3-epimerase